MEFFDELPVDVRPEGPLDVLGRGRAGRLWLLDESFVDAAKPRHESEEKDGIRFYHCRQLETRKTHSNLVAVIFSSFITSAFH